MGTSHLDDVETQLIPLCRSIPLSFYFFDFLTGSSILLHGVYTTVTKPKRLRQICTDVRRLNFHQALSKAQALLQTIPSILPDAARERINMSAIVEERILLLMVAWKALCRYTAIRHRRARKIVFQLRYENNELSSPSKSSKVLSKALNLQLGIAEEYVACQKGLYLVEQWYKRWQMRKGQSLSSIPFL